MRVAFDSMPLELDHVACRDHSALQLLGLTTCPLVAPSAIGGPPVLRPVAAVEVTSSGDARKHAFKVRADLRWTDGTRVRAQDFADAIVRTAGTASMPGYWLRGVDRVGVRGDRLDVDLRAGDHLWPLLTALPALCPQRDRWSSAGRYRLTRTSTTSFALHATRAFAEHTRPERVKVVRIKAPTLNVRAFVRGRVDVTADTAFPFSARAAWQGRPELRVTQPGVLFALTFEGDLARPGGRAVRAEIARALDDHGVREALPVPLLPTRTFLPSQRFAEDLAAAWRRHRRRLRAPSTAVIGDALRVGYDDFFPNAAVAVAIRAALVRAGRSAVLVRDRYEHRGQRVDVRLSLYRGLTSDPLAVFRGLVFEEPVRTSEALGAFERLLARFGAAVPTAQRIGDTAAELQALLDEHTLAIPLAEFPGIHLSRLPRPPWEWPA